MKTQFWRLLRTVIFLLILLSAMNQTMDERGLGGKGARAPTARLLSCSTECSANLLC